MSDSSPDSPTVETPESTPKPLEVIGEVTQLEAAPLVAPDLNAEKPDIQAQGSGTSQPIGRSKSITIGGLGKKVKALGQRLSKSPPSSASPQLARLSEPNTPRAHVRQRLLQETPMPPTVIPSNTLDGFRSTASAALVASIERSLRLNPYSKALIGLSGGSTPGPIYEMAAKEGTQWIDWSRVIFFLIDERYVTPEHKDSNQKMIRAAFSELPDENFLFPNTFLPLEDCIADYAAQLRTALSNNGKPDVVVLGFGPDGHIASWFPPMDEEEYTRAHSVCGLVSLTTTERFAVRERITVNLSLLECAKSKLFFLSGEEKTVLLRSLMVEGGACIRRQPALQVLFSGQAEVYCTPPLYARQMERYRKMEQQHLSLVVLGASGDLAKKKTYPALFTLFCEGHLPPHFNIVGYARTAEEFDAFWNGRILKYLEVTKENLIAGDEMLEKFRQRCTYMHGGYGSEEDFRRLENHLAKLATNYSSSNRLFYLALPPSAFALVVKTIKEQCWSKKGWNRIIVEKPFGHDLNSAIALSDALLANVDEPQIFRIDHYLGKEMVLNLFALRFANAAFTPLWNRHHVECIRITFKEAIGTAGRGGYFDKSGIIRDILQNHLLQLLTLVAMERPASLSDDDVRDEKVKVLKQMEPLDMKNTVLGQYTTSEDGSIPGYLQDETVPKGSRTPTFATCVAYIHNERWFNVPFIMKAGKALESQVVEIRMQFKNVAAGLFPHAHRNELVIKVQPDEAIYMKLMAKRPGLGPRDALAETELDLSVVDRFALKRLPDAYERLILDVINGDKQNFVRTDELKEAWRIFTPLLNEIESKRPKPINYKAGTSGPVESYGLVQKHGYVQSAGYTWGKLSGGTF